MSIGYQKKFCTTLKKSNIKGRVYFNEPLSRYTTFKIGGPAKIFIAPSDREDLKKILSLSRKHSIPYYILGNGSNLLVSDRGVDGIVIKLDGLFRRFNFRGNSLMAGGGADLSTLRREASKRGLSGLEFTAGIPGTLGGAIAINAGASSYDIGKLVKRVEIMDKCGSINWLSHKEIDFGYRYTSIERGAIILKAELKLKSASTVSIKQNRPLADSISPLSINSYIIKKRIDAIWRKRKKSQPVGEKSAGSIFKNPIKFSRPSGEMVRGEDKGEGVGLLIEKAGLKGKSCGKAYISPIHANFIINRGGASSNDVTRLIKEVQKEVFKQFGVDLELEIVMW